MSKISTIPKKFKEEYMKFYNKEITCAELCKKFNISRTTVWNWRKECNLPRLKKEIPENFTEKYMKYYNGEIDQYELREELKISQSTLHKWRDRCGLPVVRLKKEIPENFKEEYMKCCNERGKLKKLCKKLGISEALLFKWRNKCNLPSVYSKEEIPKNFKEEYMKYHNRETTYKELCQKFNINWSTMRQWRDKLNLPRVITEMGFKKEIPENFEEEYMKYYYREISCQELRKRLGINESTLLRWRDRCKLPCVKGRLHEREIPENFKEEYMKYYNDKKLGMDYLCKKFNASRSLIGKWRDRCDLPCVLNFAETRQLLTSEDFEDFIEY